MGGFFSLGCLSAGCCSVRGVSAAFAAVPLFLACFFLGYILKYVHRDTMVRVMLPSGAVRRSLAVNGRSTFCGVNRTCCHASQSESNAILISSKSNAHQHITHSRPLINPQSSIATSWFRSHLCLICTSSYIYINMQVHIRDFCW